MLDIIEKKRDKLELSTQEIEFFVRQFNAGEIPDYQASALLMAICLNKMNKRETTDLAMAMTNTGEKIDLSGIEGVKVDKHSSGGVGDKTTLVVGPMVAACGLAVAKMSGRGLGFSGGTIDKLESIRGFRTSLSQEEFVGLVNRNRIALMGQTANVAPVDKKIYALRDVTGTVADLSLIASSIMSKKLACDSDAVVLDVKVGSGAFMRTLEEALGLAREMVAIGVGAGKRMAAVVTNMDEPLGYAVGNALEIAEVVQALRGRGPADLMEVCMAIGAQMLVLGGLAADTGTAGAMLQRTLDNGSAYRKFLDFVAAQGGDTAQIEDPSRLPAAKYVLPVVAQNSGAVEAIRGDLIGRSTLVVGAGRFEKDDVIDYAAGATIVKKVGDPVQASETLCTIHCNDRQAGEEAAAMALGAYRIGGKPQKYAMLRAVVTDQGEEVFA